MFKEDFPSSLYSDSPPPPDQEAIDQTIEDHEAAQPGPPPTPEEVIDETESQALRDIDSSQAKEVQAEDAKRAEEAAKDIYPKPDEL